MQLNLDQQSIQPKNLSMQALKRELDLQNKPSWILRKLMNALEAKRMKKKLGWSRPWNKYGVSIFRSHILHIRKDNDYINNALDLALQLIGEVDSHYKTFIESFYQDPKRMAFVFYHNHEDQDGNQYEGLTISIGRKVPDDKTKRDRLDIVLEDLRVDGSVDGQLDRIRVYVNPWQQFQDDKMYVLDIKNPQDEDLRIAQVFYDLSIKNYHNWKEQTERQWEHWSIRYIDYFCGRSFIPQNSSFT